MGVTTPAREAAYAAATDAIEQAIYDSSVPHPRKLAEAAVDAALASLAGDLYIADRSHGIPAVFDPNRPPGTRCIIGPVVLSDAVWALLEAVLPAKERES